MMASPVELSLECKSQSYSMLLKSLAENHNSQQLPADDHLQMRKLEEYLSQLEEERLKIDAFKRELPLCMQLLTNAMETSRQQLQSYKASMVKPVLEEFIPIKNSNSKEPLDQQKAANNSSSDKASWMTSAQLWSQAKEGVITKQASSPQNKLEREIGFSPNLDNHKQQGNYGGANFLSLSKERSSNPGKHALADLALSSNEREMEDNRCLKSENGLATENSGKVCNNVTSVIVDKGMDTQTSATPSANTTTQTHRKQRRCWSPELHRRFVNALQLLGGSQVATPKQIRELMKVDGLTNDEVKSHLQKYRLHTRRPGPSPQAGSAPGPQLFVLGGIWMPPEYATAAAGHGGPPHTIYSPHPHYCPTPVPQDLYPRPAPPQAHPHQLHMIYEAPSKGHDQVSPESKDRRGSGDWSESIEDGKSDSSSCKGDSTGGERERNNLAFNSVGEDEESNGSDITLKF